MTDIEKLEIQRYSDDIMFFTWWRDLIDITSIVEKNHCLDKFHLRIFFICLYELIVSGKEYCHYAMTWNSQDLRYSQFYNLCSDISKEISDDEFFMIQYYRNSACHIFLNKYSWIKEDHSIKDDSKPIKFYKLNGTSYFVHLNDIRKIAARVIGEYGLGQDSFKHNLITRLSPIISKINP